MRIFEPVSMFKDGPSFTAYIFVLILGNCRIYHDICTGSRYQVNRQGKLKDFLSNYFSLSSAALSYLSILFSLKFPMLKYSRKSPNQVKFFQLCLSGFRNFPLGGAAE